MGLVCTRSKSKNTQSQTSSSSTNIQSNSSNSQQSETVPSIENRDLLNGIWKSICQDTDDVLQDEEADAFFLSLGVNPDGFDSLVVQYRLGFRELLQVDREAFYHALSSLSITSLVALKSAVPIWIEEAKSNNSVFRENNKGISIAAACEILQLLLSDPKFPHTQRFMSFLNSQSSIQTINLDQWMLFLDFSQAVNTDFSAYDPNEAWPVLLDDFVQWSKQQISPSQSHSPRNVSTISPSSSTSTSTSTSSTSTSTSTSDSDSSSD